MAQQDKGASCCTSSMPTWHVQSASTHRPLNWRSICPPGIVHCIVIGWNCIAITGVVTQEGDEGSEGLLLFTLLTCILSTFPACRVGTARVASAALQHSTARNHLRHAVPPVWRSSGMALACHWPVMRGILTPGQRQRHACGTVKKCALHVNTSEVGKPFRGTFARQVARHGEPLVVRVSAQCPVGALHRSGLCTFCAATALCCPLPEAGSAARSDPSGPGGPLLHHLKHAHVAMSPPTAYTSPSCMRTCMHV
jgi:hypothetical protein